MLVESHVLHPHKFVAFVGSSSPKMPTHAGHAVLFHHVWKGVSQRIAQIRFLGPSSYHSLMDRNRNLQSFGIQGPKDSLGECLWNDNLMFDSSWHDWHVTGGEAPEFWLPKIQVGQNLRSNFHCELGHFICASIYSCVMLALKKHQLEPWPNPSDPQSPTLRLHDLFGASVKAWPASHTARWTRLGPVWPRGPCWRTPKILKVGCLKQVQRPPQQKTLKAVFSSPQIHLDLFLVHLWGSLTLCTCFLFQALLELRTVLFAAKRILCFKYHFYMCSCAPCFICCC